MIWILERGCRGQTVGVVKLHGNRKLKRWKRGMMMVEDGGEDVVTTRVDLVMMWSWCQGGAGLIDRGTWVGSWRGIRGGRRRRRGGRKRKEKVKPAEGGMA